MTSERFLEIASLLDEAADLYYTEGYEERSREFDQAAEEMRIEVVRELQAADFRQRQPKG
jgi:hypothetical protein